MVNMEETSLDDFDFDIRCHNPKWLPIGFSRFSLFVKV